MIVTSHSFVPADRAGTQCAVFGCWGWVDDPRHVRDTRQRPNWPPELMIPAARKTPSSRRGLDRRNIRRKSGWHNRTWVPR